MDYPENCLRGIPNKDFLAEDGSPGSHLFYFPKEDRRTDGLIPKSINWEDDEHVLTYTLNQRRTDGEFQFQAGVVRVPRAELDRLARQPTVEGLLSYERQEIKGNESISDNPYHGNLLLKVSVSPSTMRKIAAGIALAVSHVIKRPNSA